MPNSVVLMIEDALESLGISGRRAAGEIGIAHTSLRRIRAGGTYDLDTAKKIAHWLGVKPSSILDLDDEEEDELFAKVRAMFEAEPALESTFGQAAARVQRGYKELAVFREFVRFFCYLVLRDEDHTGEPPIAPHSTDPAS